MTKQMAIQRLLKENPVAKRQEGVLLEALRNVKILRKEGIKSKGYRLIAPFGDKRQLRADEGMVRRSAK